MLSVLEYTSVIDDHIIHNQIMVIRDMLKHFYDFLKWYMTDVAELFSNLKKNKISVAQNVQVSERKYRLYFAIIDLVDSIIHWCCFAEASLLIQEFCQMAFGLYSTDVIDFVSAENMPLGIKFIGDAYCGSKAEEFRSTHGFDVGIPKKPTAIGCAWIEFQGNMQNFKWLLPDCTMTLSHGMNERMDYIFAWYKLWGEISMHLKPVNSQNPRHKWISAMKHENEQ